MIRVLHCVNDMKRAGLETMIMNYYRKIDKTKIQFDFLTHREKPGAYEEEIIKLGGKIYRAPRLYPKNYFSYFRFMKNFFNEHSEYKIVHSHIDAMSFMPLLAAKMNNIPIRIAHSHSNSIEKDYKFVLKELFRFALPKVANEYMACSEIAAKYLFGKRETIILPNAVDAEKFYFNSNYRDNIRKELKIDNSFVVGHVGRMDKVKNHEYLLAVFKELLMIDSNCILMLVGDGDNKEKLKEKADKLNIKDNVLFLGNRDDTNKLYQAMDILIFPSKFEGFGIVPIEAQYAGLSCLVSDVLPKEVKFSDDFHFLNINSSPKEWADEAALVINRKNNRKINIVNNTYDINNTYKILEDYYCNLYNKVKH